MGLSAKLLFFLVLSTVLLIGVSGGLVFQDVQNSIEDRIKIDHLIQTEQILFNIDQTLFERQADILSFASSSEIKNVLENDGVSESQNVSDLETSIEEFGVTNGFWDAVIVIDINGKKHVAVGNTLHVSAIEQTNEYQELLSRSLAGEVVYSDAILANDSRQFVFLAPVRSPDNTHKVLGTVIGYLSWPVIEEALTQVGNDQVMLINKNKEIIAHNAKASSLALEKTELEILDKVVDGENTHEVKMVDTKESFLLTGVLEKGYLQYNGNGWIVIIKIPLAEALGPAQITASRIVGILIVVSVLVFFILLLFINRTVIAPIKKLTELVSNISSGNFSERIPVSSNDELGILAKSFNIMAEKLAFIYKNLESQVENRTKDVEEKLQELEEMNRVMIGRELKMTELKKEIAELKAKLHS